MTKAEFLGELRARLSDYPESERERAAQYYDEIISDRVEDGMSEADAVAALGDMESVLRNTIADMPMQTIVKGRIKEERGKVSNGCLWAIIVALTCPVWIPVAASLFAAGLSLFGGIAAVAVAIVAVVLALIIGSVAVLVNGIAVSFTGGGLGLGLLLCGAALLVMSGTILLGVAAVFFVRLLVSLCKLIWRGIKHLFAGKGSKSK